MLEIEVKAPVADLAGLEAKLRGMGARDFGTLAQKDVYYAHPTKDFAVTDEALRIRIENDLQLLTYKGPKIDPSSKAREEIEVSVASAKATAEILERLGFRPVLTVVKRRKVLGLRGISVCLDRVDGLGDFVEFEFEGEELEKGKEEIAKLMRELDVRGNERRSYLELILLRSQGDHKKT